MFEKAKSGRHSEVIKGVHLKTLVYGEKTLMTEIKLEKGAVIPTHNHPHEQTGYLISGKLEFWIDDERTIAESGDGWNIAKEVKHSATALEQALLIEVFSPVREDYLPYYTPGG